MYKNFTKANEKLQIKRIEQETWTKGDILAFGKMLNSLKFSSKERRDKIWELYNKLKDSYSITEEQSQFGIVWLTSKLLTKKGKLSKAKFAEDFTEHDADIIRKFQRFEFVGFEENVNQYGFNSHYTPIYRTIAQNGDYFDYTMAGGHWGRPIILGRGNTSKLRKQLA